MNETPLPPEKPYDPSQDPTWAAEVNGWEWKVREEGVAYAKTGKCHRCDHEIGFTSEPVIMARIATLAEGEEPVRRQWAECNCGVVHPNAPEGRSGCGANGQIESA